MKPKQFVQKISGYHGNSFFRSNLSIFLIWISIFLFSIPVTATEIVDRIVAVVNEDIILLSDLELVLRPYRNRIQLSGYPADQAAEMLSKIQTDLLNQLIEKELAAQEAKSQKVVVEDKEIDAAIESIKSNQNQTDEAFKRLLQMQGLTMAAYREQIRGQIQHSKLINREVRSKIVITDSDLQRYYDSHSELYGGVKKYHLRNIIMRPPSMALESEIEAILERMDKVVEKLEAGESFASLAKAYSESPLSADGGDLGFFQLDEMAPQLREAIKELSPNSYTPVLETDQGYQIFYLEEIVDSPGKSLEEVSKQIEEKLYSEIIAEKYSEWMKALRARAHVKVFGSSPD